MDVTFTEPVTVAASPLAWGASGAIYSSSLQLLAGGTTLRVTFAAPVAEERLTLVLGDEVTDLAGNPLDGEMSSPLFGSLPSGNGAAGGLAVLRFDILKGDVNGDGVTNALDAALVVAALGACAGDADFSAGADLNEDGCVNVLDVQIVLSGQGGSLPALDGAPPTISSISRADGSPLTADLEVLAITFSEELNPLSIVDGVVAMRDFDGTVFLPAATALVGDGRTIECHFAPAISACGNYTVAISNAIADLSGELFVSPANPPGFTGSTPPATPILDTYTAITSAAGVTISGTIPQKAGFASAVEVRIQGPDQIVTTPASGTFSVTMPLEANESNYLYVSAISPCGIASAPVVAEVTRDNTAPNLTIQFPADTRQIFDEFVNVGGTVGDTLSGFEGLTVSVNGQPAVVDIALGQNGTWLAENVHLNPPGQATALNVIASDVLGNTVTKSITVTRTAPPRNAAYLEVLSGDDQVGLVGTALPTPIAVKVWKADGTPYANKLVDFRVTQNDGRLSGRGYGSDTMFYQVLTDASGVASASWTLGGTAGCGNHRVEATAKEVAGIALFSATAAAGTPDQINIGSGNNQRVEVGSPAPLLLSAWVSDATNPVANVPVTFTVTSGGGLVNGQTQITVPSDATGHADVEFTTGPEPGVNRVEATFVGNETNPAVFTTYGILRDYTKPTSFRGLVLDNASRPIGNVKVTLKFGTTLVGPKLTNEQGQFEFTDLTNDGAVHVIVEGFLANKLNGQPLPPGVKFPALGYDASIVPNAENTLGKPILLPPMLPENTVTWDGQSDIELTCAGIEGLVFRVKANSMTLENGSHPTVNAPVKLSLNQVHHDDIPMPMPNGVAPAFAWTFPPASATFDPPVEIEFPNMFALPAGASVPFVSFNHDTAEFEFECLASVDEDGGLIRSLPGSGLTLSGWGAPAPPPPPTTEVQNCPKFSLPKLAKDAGKIALDIVLMVVKVKDAIECANAVVGAVDTCSSAYVDAKQDGTLSASEVASLLACVTDTKSAVVECVDNFPTPDGVIAKAQNILSIINGAIAAAQNQAECLPSGVTAALNATALLTNSLEKLLAYAEDLSVKQALSVSLCFTLQLISDALTVQGGVAGDDPIAVLDELFAELNSLKADYAALNVEIGAVMSDELAAAMTDANAAYEEVANQLGNNDQLANCTARSGTQSTVADEFGGVLLTNVPLSDVPQWIEFDCVSATGTLFGRSVPFVPDSESRIVLASAVNPSLAPPLLPASISLDGTPLVLQVGSSAQVSVTATYNDGSQGDVTSGSDGTGYRLSDGTLATLSSEGVLSGVRQGTLYLTALNGATASVKKILVTNDAAPTTIVGFVQLEDGTPVENAVLVTPLGGKGVSGRDGAFSFEVEVGQQTSSLNVTAVASIRGVTYTGTKLVSPIALDGVTDAGTIVVSAEAGCSGEFGWLPGFGLPGMNNKVLALTVFDDGSGGGPALYAGGFFTTAGGVPAESIAKWNGTSWSSLGTGSASRFSVGGINALTVFDDGLGGGPALYAGGGFIAVGDVSANRIAKWDGTSWSSLGTGSANGTNGSVVALTVFDDGSGGGPALYAGGEFTTAGGVTANRIARWDGTSWSSLGTGSANGVSGAFGTVVMALAVFDDGSGGGPALVAGGDFATAGGVPANRIAKWNGTSWSSFGTGSENGVNHTVWAMAVFDDGSGGGPALVAGGDFTTAGGVTANRIAKWNGTSWSSLGTGSANGVGGVSFPSPSVRALAVFDDSLGGGPGLFVGGVFTTAGGVTANRIAKWDGTSWSSLGTGSANGVSGAFDTVVIALTVFDDGLGGGPALYAGGFFTTAGGSPANGIANWNGASWSLLAEGPANGVFGTAVFTLAVFDDGSGSGPALYAGGEFTAAGGVTANRIAKWNGTSWSSLGTGSANGVGGVSFPSPSVRALTVFDDGSGGGPALYAGGFFTTAGGAPANHVAKWNGTSWSPLGTGSANGVSSDVRALEVFDDGSGGGAALYAGGFFTTAGGAPANHIAKWNGTSWSPLGTGSANGVSSDVRALTVFDDGSGGGAALYAGGSFTTAGGVTANRIARWDGTSWSSLRTGSANGTNGGVVALTVFDDGSGGGPALYAGGEFTTAGGMTAIVVAKWNGISWSSLGTGSATGLNSTVNALTVFDDGSGGGPALYAGGDFTAGILKWNGTSWSSLGAGVTGGFAFVYAVGVFDDGSGGGPALYAGGEFTTAGGVPSSRFAKWGCVTSDNNAPSRPQPAVVARGDRRTTITAAPPTADRTLRRGESLILGDESVRLGTLTALAGSTLRLTHPNAHLTVTNLIIEPGATFEWIAGTIEIDAGAWLHPYDLTIGCDREATLLLTHDAFVRAPQVTICGLGSLVGQGVVDAPTSNAGVLAGEGTGVRVLVTYRHEASGTVAASRAELVGVSLGDVHPCRAVDEIDAATEIEPLQRLDVDHDGDLDLLRRVRLGGESLSLLWLNAGDGSYGSPILCGSTLISQRVLVEHLDEDGALDLLITSEDGLTCHAMSGGDVEVLR